MYLFICVLIGVDCELTYLHKILDCSKTRIAILDIMENCSQMQLMQPQSCSSCYCGDIKTLIPQSILQLQTFFLNYDSKSIFMNMTPSEF